MLTQTLMKKIYLLTIFALTGILPATSFAQNIDGHENVKHSRDKHKFDLEITYNDGKTEKLRSELYDNPFKHSMLVYNFKTQKEIYPEQTKQLKLLSHPFLTGMSMDSSWLFEVHSGHITIFSIYPESKLKYADYMRQGDGALIPYEKKALFKMLRDSPYGAKEIKSSRRMDTWGKILAFGGLGSLVTGLLMPESQYAPYFIGGGATMIGISLPLEIFSHDKEEHAVDVYNGHYKKSNQ